MVLILLILQTLMLIAALALLGQFIVGIFNWACRCENFVYQSFEALTRPVIRAAWVVTPRIVVDQHEPLVTFLRLVLGCLAVDLWHRDDCLDDLIQAGCERRAAARSGAAQ